MAATKGDVLAYLQNLPSQISRRFVMGQLTSWPGQINDVQQDGVPDTDVPPLVSATGTTPGLVGDIWGEVGHAEDGPHWGNPGASIGMRDAIAGLIAYWNAGSLVQVTFSPASMVGPTSATSPIGTFMQIMQDPTYPYTYSVWGRFDPRNQQSNPGPLYFPMDIAHLISGAADCAQWRAGVLYTGQTYHQLLDYHAAYLQQLKDAGVIVIYRPWAEMDSILHFQSNVSTVSMTGPDFVTMWRHVHDYFTNVKGLDNLLWSFQLQEGNSVGAGRDGLAYYPGSAYVDIVGWDYYLASGNGLASPQPAYNPLVALGKPLMFGEMGLELPGAQVTTPHDLNAWVESVKQYHPLAVGGMMWGDVFSIYKQSNVAAGLANSWLVNRPVPVLQVAPVASFTATPVPGTRTMQFQDTSV